MSTFGELFRHFPAELMELCLQECLIELRPIFYFEEGVPIAEQLPRCWVCEQVAVFHWRDDRYQVEGYTRPWADCTQECCGDARCVESFDFFRLRGPLGNRRRAEYRKKYGHAIWSDGPGEMRAARMAAVILEMSIREKSDAKNSRRAA